MKIRISISAVDGETLFVTEKNLAKDGLDFLKSYDHEGSSIGVTILAEGEEVYSLLGKLNNDSERKVKA